MTNKKKVKDIANKLNKNILETKKYQDRKFQKFYHFLLDRYDEEYINENEVIQEITSLFGDNANDMYELIETVEELNKELEVKTKESQQITEEYMKVLQVKKSITVKEFEIIYGFGASWQRERCRRVRNKLPRFQDKDNGKYMYNVADVEQWFENENIRS